MAQFSCQQKTLSYIHLTLGISFDSQEYGKKLELEGTCACANKTSRQQYLWTWCQGVLPNDFPQDFCTWVAFMSYGSDTYRHRQAGRDREISQPLDHIFFFKEPFILTLEDSLFYKSKIKEEW